MRYQALIVVIILILLAGVLALEHIPSSEDSWQRDDYDEEETSAEDSTINLFFVGDMMLNRGVAYAVREYGNNDFRFPFLNIRDKLQEADVLFGNLEGSISNRGERVGSIYSFRFEPAAIEGLVYAGFDVLSLANNHMFDYQRIALEDTFDILKENGIDYVGAGLNKEEAFSLKIREVNDTKIGFLAYTNLGPANWRAGEDYSGLAWINEEGIELVTAAIKKARAAVDLLIVSLHSGQEYAARASDFQVSFSQQSIAAGADLVIGHHPHVVQGIETYTATSSGGEHTGWVAYSLGNFIFDQSFSEETMESIILKVSLREKTIAAVSWERIKMNEYYQPALIKE